MPKISITLFALFLGLTSAQAQDRPQFEIPAVTVPQTQKIYHDTPVIDQKIISGKKVTTIDKKEQPPTPNNNYRQILAEVPGLMVSEVNNESFTSFTYRGLGDPHESFNILTLRNGLPGAPDPYGYPAAYYTPPSDSLERIDFYRGGAGLLYGPQPGGALNYVLRRAPKTQQEALFRTTNLVGSFGRYSTYNEYTQHSGNTGVLASAHARGSQGFRENNSDTRILNPRLDFSFSLSETSLLRLDLDLYQGRFGEPGGLAKNAATNVLTLDDPEKTTLNNDRLEIDRTGVVLGWEKTWSSSTTSNVEVWNSQFRRESFRQSLGASPAFGGIALGTTNTIQNQKFNTYGLQTQFQHDYNWQDQRQILTVSLQAIKTESPFLQATGATPTAREGTLTREILRKTDSQALVVENAFQFSPWTLTPAVRLETIRQEIDEKLKPASAVPLRQETKTVQVGLLGLGLEYKTEKNAVIYSNVSQGYKPPAFQDTVPLGTTDTISEDLKEARTLAKEIGVRGHSQNMEYDISVFQVDFSNIFGRVGANFQNVGASRAEGLDILLTSTLAGSWKTFASASLLNSRFVSGPLEGKKTQYSPDQTLRGGLGYHYQPKSQVRLQVQNLSAHYGDDANSANFELASSTTWDLTGVHHVSALTARGISLNWGVQNLLNSKTPTRVRSNGYEPAQPVSVYGGFTAEF